MAYNLDHLKDYPELDIGPIQRDEALLLYSMIRVLRPRVVVEFGFMEGHSAGNFLSALAPEAVLYSFDSDPACAARAASLRDPRLRFVGKRQEDFLPADIDGRPVDFLFLDAAHEARANWTLFERCLPCLAERAVVAVHDTGLWNKALIPPDWGLGLRHVKLMEGRDPSARLDGTRFAHQPEERRFVNRLLELRPDFHQLHLHSMNTVRHGLTLLQRSSPLEVGPAPVKG